jgi:hypothetical protein
MNSPSSRIFPLNYTFPLKMQNNLSGGTATLYPVYNTFSLTLPNTVYQ